ncbi:Acetyltransferase (GNAT) family [Bordetella ansorpii]|uniref:Acetyltransferase (GNAT) family n=1 Tax=Bordetella ansorpii TaxID=288768 RepID=A0A157QN11_9BORD|nr:GNAT family N-acetyltransferase [Bordetella ansorpii]SAI46980.1 Acetyltransferase (GNAT) family [Bordetella ansorpii]
MTPDPARPAIAIDSVSPDSQHWATYLALYAEYLRGHWPQEFGQIPPERLAQDNDDLLRARWAEGGRGLFLLHNETKPAGLANAWLDKQGPMITLQIAELYIRSDDQRRGWGSLLLQAVERWGKAHGATGIALEADADKPEANAFWRARGLTPLANDGQRIVYGGALTRGRAEPEAHRAKDHPEPEIGF